MAGAEQFDGWGCLFINGEGCVDAAGEAAFILFCQAQEMAKAVKGPIRRKAEAFRGASDAVEGRAVRDEAWFNAQNPKRLAVTAKLPGAKQPRKLRAHNSLVSIRAVQGFYYASFLRSQLRTRHRCPAITIVAAEQNALPHRCVASRAVL